jgi:hypothetical protein
MIRAVLRGALAVLCHLGTGACFLCLMLAGALLHSGVRLRAWDELGSPLSPSEAAPGFILGVAALLLAVAAVLWGLVRLREARRWGPGWKGLACGVALQESFLLAGAGLWFAGLIVGAAIVAEGPVAAAYVWGAVASVGLTCGAAVVGGRLIQKEEGPAP